LERVNSEKWWGEGSISDLALFSSFIEEASEYRDAASFEECLLFIAKWLKDNGIETTTLKSGCLELNPGHTEHENLKEWISLKVPEHFILSIGWGRASRSFDEIW